jgi:excisionase family DNA binding protein
MRRLPSIGLDVNDVRRGGQQPVSRDREPVMRTDVAAGLELLTPAEAMRLLRVSRSWLYEAAKNGRIPAIRLGGATGPVRFVKTDLLAHTDAAHACWRRGDTSGSTVEEWGAGLRESACTTSPW